MNVVVYKVIRISPQKYIHSALQMINYIMFGVHTQQVIESIYTFISSLKGHIQEDILNELEELIKNIQNERINTINNK